MGGFDGHPGTAKLAAVLSQRMKKEKESPLVLDFGEILANYSLVTNTFPVPIPKGDYSVCRHLTIGHADGRLTITADDGRHDEHVSGDGIHSHIVLIPEKMRSVGPGDRVLVAWVHYEAVVIDIIEKS